jgi:two-component system, OmpR family, sensor histidine kinase KdpD
MGLAICRSIIEAHEGRISAASVPEQGSTVGFTLPIASKPDARIGD